MALAVHLRIIDLNRAYCQFWLLSMVVNFDHNMMEDTWLTKSAWFYKRGTSCMFKQVHSGWPKAIRSIWVLRTYIMIMRLFWNFHFKFMTQKRFIALAQVVNRQLLLCLCYKSFKSFKMGKSKASKFSRTGFELLTHDAKSNCSAICAVQEAL